MSTYTFFLKLIISGFIIFNLIVIACWMFPNHPIEQALIENFRQYLGFLALNQDYSVFAPNPRSVNVHLEALVTYSDGTTRIWRYPRTERMNLWQAMIKERYRKFGDDNIAWTLNNKLLQDLARYVARLTSNGSHKAMMVTLIRYFAAIPPFPYGLNEKLPAHYEVHILNTYAVKAEDLQ